MPGARVEKTTDNLCDTCIYEMPSCPGKNVEFGNGQGEDNIIFCNIWERKVVYKVIIKERGDKL